MKKITVYADFDFLASSQPYVKTGWRHTKGVLQECKKIRTFAPMHYLTSLQFALWLILAANAGFVAGYFTCRLLHGGHEGGQR